MKICSRHIAQNMNEKFEKFFSEIDIVWKAHIHKKKSDFDKFVYRGVKEARGFQLMQITSLLRTLVLP